MVAPGVGVRRPNGGCCRGRFNMQHLSFHQRGDGPRAAHTDHAFRRNGSGCGDPRPWILFRALQTCNGLDFCRYSVCDSDGGTINTQSRFTRCVPFCLAFGGISIRLHGQCWLFSAHRAPVEVVGHSGLCSSANMARVAASVQHTACVGRCCHSCRRFLVESGASVHDQSRRSASGRP